MERRFFKALHAWEPKQNSKTAQAKADHYPPSHFSPFNCSLSVVLQLEKGAYPENGHVVFCHNT